MNRAELVGMVRRRAPALVLSAALILFVVGLSDFWTFVIVGGLATATVALSVGVVYGRTGMVTLCQFSFAAVGVWAIAWLNVHTSLPFVVMLLLAGAAAIPFGLVIGLLSLRLRGVNLAVTTLGFASASLVVLRVHPFPGFFSNRAIARPAGFTSEIGYFLFCCIVFAALVALLSVISRTHVGRGWLAVRQSDRAAAALGLSVRRVKLTAFSTGAFIAGIGGGLLAGQNGVLSLRSFEPFDSLLIFAISVLAGARYVDGAIAAGLLGAVLPELLRKWGIPLDVAPMLFGVGAVAVLSKGGDGAHGQLRSSWAARNAARRGRRGPGSAGPGSAGPGSAGLGDAGRAQVDVRKVAVGGKVPNASDGLVLEGLSVSYGAVAALDGVTLTVVPGQVHGLIGPNGAGKTTLIDTVSGFVQATSGRIRLSGGDLGSMPVHQRARAGLRRTFQQGRAIEEMDVGDYLTFAAGRPLDAHAVADILGFFGCPPPGRRISSLDVATRRLVELAACIASGAVIVLLDEPGAGLADAESLQLARCLREVPQRFGCGVLLVEHDMEIVRAACDHVTVLDAGSVIASGPPEQVLADPAVVAAYLGRDSSMAGGAG